MFYHLNLRSKEIYIIRRKDLNDPIFFLQHWEHNNYPFVYSRWTPVQQRAHEFISEESVEMFKYKNLQHHPCEIIRIKN